jgi:glycerophosphoryl diester phosphodiesterase
MQVYAHRGASAVAPENTLAAFDRAAGVAGFVELDVQRCRSGELVVVHDTTLDRTTDVETVFPDRPARAVGDFTLAELRRLDAGSWFSTEFAGERIPTLAEVLDFLRDRDLGLLLEAKSPERGAAGQIADELLRNRWILRDRLVVQSFDEDFVREFRSVFPRATLGLLGAPADVEPWVRIVDQINPHHVELQQSYVDSIHNVGLSVNPWTVDEPADIARMIDLGVDGIITNTPDRVVTART